MTKLNWTHYKTRVARAIEAGLEKVSPDDTVAAEEVLESIMREDGLPVDQDVEILEIPDYYRMLVALEGAGEIEIHPKRSLDGVVPGWGLRFPDPAEETPEWKKVLVALAPALIALLANNASKPPAPSADTLPWTIRPPVGCKRAAQCSTCHSAGGSASLDPSEIESWIRGEQRPAGTSDEFLKTLLDIASGSPGLSAMTLTKEDQEALATGDLKAAATWHKLSPRLREFLLAAGLSAPEGYMAPAPPKDAAPAPASASEPQPGVEPKEPV